MSTLALIIEYDGTNYSGWQIQPNSLTIQEVLQTTLTELFQENITLIASGRTDAGVHASGQVATTKVMRDVIPKEKLMIAINSRLPSYIQIKKAVYTDKDFHARFDAVSRKYIYKLASSVSVFKKRFVSEIKYPFNPDKLDEIANIFLGTHDFTTFSKINPDIKNNICIVSESRWEHKRSGIHVFHLKANHFLYGMVRSLVGASIDFARGKRTFDDITKALAAKNRSLASPFAAPTGLYLEEVSYAEEINQILKIV